MQRARSLECPAFQRELVGAARRTAEDYAKRYGKLDAFAEALVSGLPARAPALVGICVDACLQNAQATPRDSLGSSVAAWRYGAGPRDAH
jgi:hypothetical protein